MKFLQSLHIVNFDQTGLNVAPVLDWTKAAAGAKTMEVAGKDDKKQLTALLGGSLTGDFLPTQIIQLSYERMRMRM